MMTETGILGLGAFLWMLTVYVVMGWRSMRRINDDVWMGLAGGVLVFLIHSFFDNNLYSLQLSSVFWFLLGLSASLYSHPSPKAA